MITRTALAAALATMLLAGPAFAVDAGATDASSGVTPTADAGSTADAGTSADAGSSADGGSATDAGGTTDSFTLNPCWDEKCPKEVDACKKNADCAFLAKCVKDSKGDKTTTKCAQDAKWDQAKFSAASEIYTKILNCGWTACADPTKGSCKDQCGKYLGDNAPCNCDGFCVEYKDCCQDHKGICSDMYSCKGKCGQGRSQQNASQMTCSCAPNCKDDSSCCEDYDLQCGGAPCEPKCAGKECGDDGCGKSCGECTGGAVCDATGKCIGGGGSSSGGTADAGSVSDAGSSSSGGSSGASSSGGATDATADTGSSSGGTTTTTTNKDDSGCSATPTGNNANLALVLLALGMMVLVRRRFV